MTDKLKISNTVLHKVQKVLGKKVMAREKNGYSKCSI